MGFFDKIKDGLKKTRENISGQIDAMLNSFTKIDESLFDELEELLILGDVGAATSAEICGELRSRIKQRGVTDPAEIREMLREIVAEMLRGGEELTLSTRPSVVLVIGVNGTGKTTTAGKLAARLSRQGKKVILGAADTFRAAAIEQLEIWAQRSGAELVKQTQEIGRAHV